MIDSRQLKDRACDFLANPRERISVAIFGSSIVLILASCCPGTLPSLFFLGWLACFYSEVNKKMRQKLSPCTALLGENLRRVTRLSFCACFLVLLWALLSCIDIFFNRIFSGFTLSCCCHVVSFALQALGFAPCLSPRASALCLNDLIAICAFLTMFSRKTELLTTSEFAAYCAAGGSQGIRANEELLERAAAESRQEAEELSKAAEASAGAEVCRRECVRSNRL